jgi:hypothetical protein
MAKSKIPNNKKSEKAAWKTDAYDGAFLFLLFERGVDHPDDFSPSELQQNPSYPFAKYSTQNFKRSSQTVTNKVKKFVEKGTGLTQVFKAFIKEALDDNPVIFAGGDEDDYDEDYEPEDEDDLEESSKLVDEHSLNDDLQDTRFDRVPQPQPPVNRVNI